MSTLLINHPVFAGSEVWDSVRGRVNRAWYEFLVQDCAPNQTLSSSEKQKVQLSNFLVRGGYCAKGKGVQHFVNNVDGFQEKVFFDIVATEQAKENTCLLNVLDQYAVADNPRNAKQNELAIQLEKIYPASKGKFAKQISNKNISEAKKSQKQMLISMLEKAKHLEALEKEKNSYVRNVSPLPTKAPRFENSNIERTKQIETEIALLKQTIPFYEFAKGAEFFHQQVWVRNSSELAKDNANLDQLAEKMMAENLFDTKLIAPLRDQFVTDQAAIVKMNGEYKDQHTFKVKAFESGAAQRVFEGVPDGPEMIAPFRNLYCSFESRYGIGSEMSSTGNTAIAGALTAGAGLATMTSTKLVQMGLISARTAKSIELVAGIANSAVARSELLASVMNECIGDSTKFKQGYCAKSDFINQYGVVQATQQEQDNSNCVMAASLAALQGAGDLRKSLNAKALRIEKELQHVYKEVPEAQGVVQRAVEQIAESKLLTSTQKRNTLDEIAKAVKVSNKSGQINKEMIEVLAKSAPEELLKMLRQINSEQPTTWLEKVKAWLASKKSLLNKEQREQVLTCLINKPQDISWNQKQKLICSLADTVPIVGSER